MQQKAYGLTQYIAKTQLQEEAEKGEELYQLQKHNYKEAEKEEELYQLHKQINRSVVA